MLFVSQENWREISKSYMCSANADMKCKSLHTQMQKWKNYGQY